MSNFINFFPGDTRDARSIELCEEAAYGMAADLGDFLDSMRQGCTASIPSEGVKDALEDGEFLGAVKARYGMHDEALQELVEELHDALQESGY